MKKEFETPVMEIITFQAEDVIVTSTANGGDGAGCTDTPGIPGSGD